MNTLTSHHKYVCDVQFLQNPCKSTPPKACRQASPTLLSLEWRAVHMWERKELLHWRKPVKCRNTTHILLCMKLKGTIGFGQFQWTLSGTSLRKKYLGHTHKCFWNIKMTLLCIYSTMDSVWRNTMEWKYVGRAQRMCVRRTKKVQTKTAGRIKQVQMGPSNLLKSWIIWGSECLRIYTVSANI